MTNLNPTYWLWFNQIRVSSGEKLLGRCFLKPCNSSYIKTANLVSFDSSLDGACRGAFSYETLCEKFLANRVFGFCVCCSRIGRRKYRVAAQKLHKFKSA